MPLAIKRLILDVLKPHYPPLHEFIMHFNDIPHVRFVTVSLLEIDESTQSIRLEIEGDGIDFKIIKDKIEELGAALHSVDEVSIGR